METEENSGDISHSGFLDESYVHSRTSDEALQRWRAAAAAVRGSRKRFRYTANLDESKQMGGRSSSRRNISSFSSSSVSHHGYQGSPYPENPSYYPPQHVPASSNYGARTPQPYQRLDSRYSRIADNYASLEELRPFVTAALAEAGLESSNLTVGIDFTKNNEWTGARSFNHRSLHHLGGNFQNPYEQAISIIGKTLAPFDEDNLIPCFGFGDASTHDHDVFSFYPDARFYNGFEEVLKRYRELVPHLRLSGPTSFAPITDMAMKIVEDSGGQYHVLPITADGEVTRTTETPHGKLSQQEQKTMEAIFKACKQALKLPEVKNVPFLDFDGSLQPMGNYSIIPEHGFGRTIRTSGQEVMPVCLRSGRADHFQDSAFAGTPDVGRSHLFTSISGAPNNSVAVPDAASGWLFNRQEASNGVDIRIDILDGNYDKGGKTGMTDVCSPATNSTVASSSGYYEFTCDNWTHVPSTARHAYSVGQLNHHGTSREAEVTHANFFILKDDDHQALPVKPDDCPDETKFQTKINNIILGITGQAAVALVSSSSSDTPFLRFFAAATGIGFLGSFFANYILKKPKIARILSKIGAVGAASAVIIALGLYFPKDTKWNLNIVATVAACLISAAMVASS